MPFGAVFTTSAGGDIGGGRLRTRFRGPILAGYASTADPGGQTMLAAGGGVAGTAAQPMYSYYVRPDMGTYAFGVTTSAPDLRVAMSGFDMWSWSTTQIGVMGSSQASAVPVVTAAGFLASATNAGALYIPQTTYAVSSSSGTSSGATPTAFNSGVAMIFDSLRNKISVFSTVANQWLSVTLTSS